MNNSSCFISNITAMEVNMDAQTIESPRAGGHHVCPWWVAYFFDNPLRRLIHPADKVLGPYVTPGMTVLDFGCGFGHYALGMARLTGASGRVIAADLQQKMLDKTMNRARNAGLDTIIRPLLCRAGGIGIPLELDFALASNSLHETPDPAVLLAELFKGLKPGGRFLLMEPRAHMKAREFNTEVDLAQSVGFKAGNRPQVLRQWCALLQKPKSGRDT
jgi:SAM-dependent methyltransferase